MKKTIQLLPVFLILCIGLAVSCKKKKSDATTPDAKAFLKPQEKDTIFGDSVFTIEGYIQSNMDLSGYSVAVIQKSNDSILFEKVVNSTAAYYTVSHQVKHKLQEFTKLKLQVGIFSTDGKQGFNSYDFFYNP